MGLNIIVYRRGHLDDYSTAEIDEDHEIHDPWYEDSFHDVDAWCEQTFGDQDLWGEQPVSGWKRMRNVYYFVDPGHLNLFVLRWR